MGKEKRVLRVLALSLTGIFLLLLLWGPVSYTHLTLPTTPSV